ncbi:SulP family inorganic anion transporter [soil metagenome]
MSHAADRRRIEVVALLPGLANFRGYQRSWFVSDVQAGVSVAAYLVPQALAYATLAGLSPITGLWAALPPLFIYALLGSSRQLSVGPESTTALMTATVVAPLTIGQSPSEYASYAAALAVIVGMVCLTAGVLKLGFLANLLSKPVLVGYLAGIALVMIGSQLGRVTGSPLGSGETLIDQLRTVSHLASQVNWPTVALSSAVVAVILIVDRCIPRLPGPLIGVVLATVVVVAFGLQRYGISVVGDVQAHYDPLEMPGWTSRQLTELLIPALGIATVAFSDNVLTARAFAARVGQDIDPNAELRALGVCNVTAGLSHGFPVSSSGSRTALGAAAGSRTQVYSLATLVVALAAVTVGGEAIAVIPSAALGALVIYAATRLIDIEQFMRLARFRRSELFLAVVTAVSVAGLGVLQGVLAAVALSVLDLLRRLARAHDSVQGFVPGVAGMHDVDDYPDAVQIPGLVVYRYDAPLCFANAEDFRRRAIEAMDLSSQPVSWFVLNAEANVEVDMTAVDALERLRAECDRRGVIFAMARVKQDLRDALTAAGMIAKIGENRLFPTLPTAVAAFKAAHGGADDAIVAPL